LSIEDSQKVDFISIDKEGNVVLTISDHLEWVENNEHLLILQNKINSYLAFIENGNLYEQYPDTKDKKIIISIVAKFLPDNDGELFLKRAKEILNSAGYNYAFSML
jgi:hypothetical protein